MPSRTISTRIFFNNLNILSALIDTDTTRSREYVDKLADVYWAISPAQGR